MGERYIEVGETRKKEGRSRGEEREVERRGER